MPEDTITITLSDKADVEWLRAKVSVGEFASETEAVADAVARLRQDDNEKERWIREVVIPRLERHTANPQALIPLEDVVKHLEERRKSRELASR